MGRSTHCRILFGLLALVAAGSCGGDTTPGATGATVRKTAPTTVPADPYEVPATIDKAYLDKVFAALDAVDSEATRIIVQQRGLPPAAADRLVSIYGENEFRAQSEHWLDLIDHGLPGFRADPGLQKTEVVRLISSTPQCAFVVARRDHSAVASEAPPMREIFVYLAPLNPIRNKQGFNPTPWMIEGAGFNADGSMPGDPCAG